MITSTTIWTVRIGDRLPTIAAQVYGDPRLWRAIAAANRIDDPLRFPDEQDIGRMLLVPRQRP